MGGCEVVLGAAAVARSLEVGDDVEGSGSACGVGIGACGGDLGGDLGD